MDHVGEPPLPSRNPSNNFSAIFVVVVGYFSTIPGYVHISGVTLPIMPAKSQPSH